MKSQQFKANFVFLRSIFHQYNYTFLAKKNIPRFAQFFGIPFKLLKSTNVEYNKYGCMVKYVFVKTVKSISNQNYVNAVSLKPSIWALGIFSHSFAKKASNTAQNAKRPLSSSTFLQCRY